MPIQNVGDMSQHFQSLRQVGEVKANLNRLSNELATQQKADITASLRGATAQLETHEREINRITGYLGAIQQVGQRLSVMQTTLEGVDTVRNAAMAEFLGITTDSSDLAVQNAAVTGEAALTSFVSSFNNSLGGFALFSGAATDRAPLASAELMLDDIKSSIVGLDTVDDIIAAVDIWFADPVGGFATLGYLGDTGTALEQNIGTGNKIEIQARANDPAVVALLKSAVVAAIADESVPGLTNNTRAELVAASGQFLVGAADDLTDMRAALGTNEANVAEANVTLSTQLTAFEIERNTLTVADPFETATRLQDVQQQLELQYTMTARLSQLSLVNFLR